MTEITMSPEFEARNRLRKIVGRTTELTPLKVVATKAIQMAQDERTGAMDLAMVISSDQALTAKVLRLSNSPYYGYARRISNVREAVILLGMRTVRSVAISSAIIDAFKMPKVNGFDIDLFWAHGVCVGLVAEILAKETRVCRPEDAFTAGVIHDIGKLATMVAEPELFGQITDMVLEEGLGYPEAERRVMQLGHEHIGAKLAQRWKFPETLVDAIARHHQDEPLVSITSLADIVAAADMVCNREGLAAGFDWTKDEERRSTIVLPARVDEAMAKVPRGIQGVEEKARAFLLNVTARAPHWYAHFPAAVVEDELEEIHRQVA